MDEISTLALKVDTKSAVDNLRKFGDATTQIGGLAGMLNGKLMQLSATFLSVNFAKSLVDSAADAQEAAGKYEQVLGRMTKQADRVVEELRSSFNFDLTGAQQSVSTMVDLFTKAGIGMEDALKYTEDLQKRSSDLEAFTNAEGGLERVTNAVTSAMLGETESIKLLGVVIKEENIQSKMAEERSKGLTFTTERAAKMHATYSLIMEQSASAHGQVAREADNMGNKIRSLRGAWGDLRRELGDVLIPVADKLIGITSQATKALEGTPPAVKTTIVAFGSLVGATVALSPVIGKLVIGLKTLSATKKIEAAVTQKESQNTEDQTTEEERNVLASREAIDAKRDEASARTLNARSIDLENNALKAQNSANKSINSSQGKNILGGKNNASKTQFGDVMSKKDKRAAKIAWRNQTAGQRAFEMLPDVDLPSPSLKEKLQTKWGKAGRNSLPIAGTLGKAEGAFVKLGASAGKFSQTFLKIAGTIDEKIPVFKRLAPMITRLTGLAIPGINIIAGVTTALSALSLFKNAPEHLEEFLESGWPKIKGFAEKIPGAVVDGMKSGLSKTYKSAVESTSQGILGLSQVVKRLAGFETEASRAYQLNKRIEDANKARERLIAIEESQRQAEAKSLSLMTELRQKQLNAQLSYVSSLNDAQEKLSIATKTRDETRAKISQKQNELEKGQYDLQGIALSESQISKKIQANNAEAAEKLNGTLSSREQKKILQERDAQNAQLEAELQKLADKRGEITDRMSALSEEIGTLTESYAQQRIEVDEATREAEAERKAREDDQKSFSASVAEHNKALKEQALQSQLDNAKTRNERLQAIQANVAYRQQALQESLDARGVVDDKNRQIQEINKSLDNEVVSRQIPILMDLAKSGATDENAELSYASALSALEEAGYNVDDNYYFGSNAAASLLETVNKQRGEKRSQREALIAERDEAFKTADEEGQRRQALIGANDMLQQEQANQFQIQNADSKRQQEFDAYQSDLQKRRESEYQDVMYRRQLGAIESSYDMSNPWQAEEALGLKYDLVANKGAQDWNNGMTELNSLGSQIDEFSTLINDIKQKEEAGLATDEEIQKRQQLEGERNSLQERYDSTYDSMMQGRYQNEDELSALERQMGEQEDKKNGILRDYATKLNQGLEEQMKAEEEARKKELEERSAVEKEQRQAVGGSKAISSGSSEAFNIQSRIFNRGELEIPTDKKIEQNTSRMDKSLYNLSKLVGDFFAYNRQNSDNNVLTIQ